MNIRALKLVSGEDIIGVVSNTEHNITIENPIRLMMVPMSNPQSQPSFGFAPFPVYATGSTNFKLTISKSHIIFDIEPDQEFINQYNSIFGTGIVTPSKSIIV